MSQQNNWWDDTRTKPMKEPTITMCLPADQFHAMQEELAQLRAELATRNPKVWEGRIEETPSDALLKDLAMQQPEKVHIDTKKLLVEMDRNWLSKMDRIEEILNKPYRWDFGKNDEKTAADTVFNPIMRGWSKEKHLAYLKQCVDRGEHLEDGEENGVSRSKLMDGYYYNEIWGDWSTMLGYMARSTGWHILTPELSHAEILAELKLGRRFHIPKKVTIYQHEAEDGIVAKYYLRMGGFDTDFHPWSEVPALLESITGWKRVS